MVRTYCKAKNYGTVNFLNSTSSKPASIKIGLRGGTVKNPEEEVLKNLAAEENKSKKKVLKTQQRRKATNNVVSKKQKKQKTKFEYSDNTSDFVSCNSNETTSGHGTLETPEFSFNFKHKSEEKENSFDKLFDGIQRNANKPVFSNGFDSSSLEYNSTKNSSSSRLGLFQSINGNETDSLRAVKPTRKKAIRAPKPKLQKVFSKRSNLRGAVESKPSERCFSNETLDYITKKLDVSLRVEDSEGRIPNEEDQNSQMKNVKDSVSTNVVGVRSSFDELSPVKKVSNRKSKKIGNLSLADVGSPAAGTMATSTPTLQNCDVFRTTVDKNSTASSPYLPSGPRVTISKPSASSPEFRSFEKSSPEIREKSLVECELSQSPTNKKSLDIFDDDDDDLKMTAGRLSINDVSHLNKDSIDLFEYDSKDDVFHKATENHLSARSESKDLFSSNSRLASPQIDIEKHQVPNRKTSTNIRFQIPSIVCEAMNISIENDKTTKARKTSSIAKPGKMKHWQRKSVIVVSDRRKTVATALSMRRTAFVTSTRRRATQHAAPEMLVPQIQKIVDDVTEEEEEDEEDVEDDAEEVSPQRKTNLDTSRRGHLNLSSSYIVVDERSLSTISDQILQEDVISKVLSRCNNDEVVPLIGLYDEDIVLKSKKIGEGAFGEVFLLSTHSAPVLKIVPVNGSAPVNGQPQTKLSDMLAEIIITTELSHLRQREKHVDDFAANFVEVRNCYLTSGDYPESFLQLWDRYDEERESENDRPDSNLFAGQEEVQKFVVLEFSNGGDDLEHVTLNNAAQGIAVFIQVAHALAVAENCFEFEHRDLHWGNILVRKCDESSTEFVIEANTLKVDTFNVCATIIDFSLSRMKSPKDGCRIFNNLAEDEELFGASGDYQFDIYRMMREHTCNEWQGFYPKTNLMWLHYLLDKLISEVKYKNKNSKIHKNSLVRLKHLKSIILDFSSAKAFVLSEDCHA